MVKYVGKLLEYWDMISLVNPLMQVLLNESQVESMVGKWKRSPIERRGESLKISNP